MLIEDRPKIEKCMRLQEPVAAIFLPLPPGQCCGGIPVRLQGGERVRENPLRRAGRWTLLPRTRRDVRGSGPFSSL